MIAKIIPAKTGSRTFAHLVDYVAAENRLERPRGREFDEIVRYVGRENVVDAVTGEVIAKAVAIETQGVASLRTAALEMEAVAAQCRRLRAPADYHLVLSWHEGERPTPDQAFAAGRHALAALGMQEHQYVMAVHGDTPNVHLHIAVNRVNPETYRAVSPFRDYLKLDRAMREIELEQGWAHDRGPAIATERGVVLVFKEQTHGRGLDEPARMSSRARNHAAWSGERPFTAWVREAAPALKTTLAHDDVELADVRRTLGNFGLDLRTKGSGLVVVDQHDPNLVAKASQIARFMSRDRLEERVGPVLGRVPAFQVPERQVELSTTLGRDGPVDQHGRVAAEVRETALERSVAGNGAGREMESRREYRHERRFDEGEDQRDRERLEAEFQATRRRADQERVRWEEQRATERARYAEIAARKMAHRHELRETGLAPQIAVSLAAFRAASERADLREVITDERAALKHDIVHERRMAWREFVAERAVGGDEAAVSVLRDLRHQAGRPDNTET